MACHGTTRGAAAGREDDGAEAASSGVGDRAADVFDVPLFQEGRSRWAGCVPEVRRVSGEAGRGLRLLGERLINHGDR